MGGLEEVRYADVRAQEGALLQRETTDLAKQFPQGKFPFSEGRNGESIPGKVVGYQMGVAETRVVSGVFILGPDGVFLHAVGSEMRIGGGMVPYVTPCRVREATPEEHFNLRGEIRRANDKLRDMKMRDGQLLAGDA